MIRYTLKCDKDHVFESWFASADAYESLKAAGHMSCAVCGSASVEKTLMSPAVAAKGAVTAPTPSSEEEAFRKMRAHIEANSEDVGKGFAKRARDMHEGLEPEKPIYGEASAKEAKKLVEDGVPIAPLPFIPTRKTN